MTGPVVAPPNFGPPVVAAPLPAPASLPAPAPLAPPPGSTLHKRLADFSFSLYCIHTPLLMLYVSVLMYETGVGWHMKPTTPHVWLFTAAALPFSMACAWLFARLTERHTDAVRRWLFRRFDLG